MLNSSQIPNAREIEQKYSQSIMEKVKEIASPTLMRQSQAELDKYGQAIIRRIEHRVLKYTDGPQNHGIETYQNKRVALQTRDQTTCVVTLEYVLNSQGHLEKNGEKEYWGVFSEKCIATLFKVTYIFLYRSSITSVGEGEFLERQAQNPQIDGIQTVSKSRASFHSAPYIQNTVPVNILLQNEFTPVPKTALAFQNKIGEQVVQTHGPTPLSEGTNPLMQLATIKQVSDEYLSANTFTNAASTFSVGKAPKRCRHSSLISIAPLIRNSVLEAGIPSEKSDKVSSPPIELKSQRQNQPQAIQIVAQPQSPRPSPPSFIIPDAHFRENTKPICEIFRLCYPFANQSVPITLQSPIKNPPALQMR